MNVDNSKNDIIKCRIQYINDLDPFQQSSNTYSRKPLVPLLYMLLLHQPISKQLPDIIKQLKAPHKSGDAVLQILPNASGELSSILDSDLSLSEQCDELQILQYDSRSSLILRQQPALKVKLIIDELVFMSGRDQRQALFSLKSIFQNDKDLVHEFVKNGGLECLIKIGQVWDQNYQNYILRAIGQLMLYVDGMNGIIYNNETICWLYQLLNSSYLLVVKTALKLLLVFVEYTESNSLLLLAAISKVEKLNDRPEWFSLMQIFNKQQTIDEETLVFGMTVLNKTLNGIPDQDTFFDVVDVLESQNIEQLIKAMLKMNNVQLTQQCNQYEQELLKEDALLENNFSSIDDDVAKIRSNTILEKNIKIDTSDRRSDRLRKKNVLNCKLIEDFNNTNNNKMIANKFEHFQKQQKQQNEVNLIKNKNNSNHQNSVWHDNDDKKINVKSKSFLENSEISDQFNETLKLNSFHNSTLSYKNSKILQNNNDCMDQHLNNENSLIKINTTAISYKKIPFYETQLDFCEIDKIIGLDEKENINSKNEKNIDLQVKAPPPSIPTNIFSPTEIKMLEFSDLKEKTILASTSSLALESENDKPELANNSFVMLLQKRAKKIENSLLQRGTNDIRQSESELKWNEAANRLKEKPLIINDLDFSEFIEFEQDPLVMIRSAQAAQEKNGQLLECIPPAPPPIFSFKKNALPPPPAFKNIKENVDTSPYSSLKTIKSIGTCSGTLKLHWKPAHSEALPIPALKRKGTFWNQVAFTPQIDTTKLFRLFEQKAKDLPVKKTGNDFKPQVLQVLSVKRSQAINIGLTKLPPITVIPTAIRKFDASVLNKEGIEKILNTMMPLVEEVERIQSSQSENPDIPLGQAEQFMLSLSEIDCLLERLRLWLFMLDYHNLEKDVAESLMELNNAMKEIEESKTFCVAMGMLLTIGNTLNGTDIKAFQLDYLSKASEVKDPVHKYSLTHHLAEYMIDNYTEGTDLYSELSAVSRSSRIDFDSVLDNLKKIENDCKASFDYVSKISQRDNNLSMKNKVNIFLTEVAERIHRLKHVHRTTMHRWNAFLLYFGFGIAEVKEQKPIKVFKMVIEFALEYRTNREKILQMRKRMTEKKERNKTRGIMIGMAQAQSSINTKNYNTILKHNSKQYVKLEMSDQERHQEMSKLLTSNVNSDDSMLNRRKTCQKTLERSLIAAQTENIQDDELLDGVVRTVTAQAETRDQNRRKARLFNRKSLRRTRTIQED